jgi:[ribosomal protein S18]-alanine N-acetyltransferase
VEQKARSDQQAGAFVIGRGGLQDLDRLVDLEHEAFSAPWTRKMFQVELEENPFGHLWTARLASKDGAEREIVGYICFWIVFEELRFMNLAVESRFRRQGVARTLVRRALAFARDRGALRAVLEVRASNDAAQALYEEEGFKRVAIRAKYYPNPVEDAVLMALDPLPSERVAESHRNAEK